MSGANREGLISVLLRREDLLEALIGATRTKPELTELVDVSRSTVDRAVRTLESSGLVQRSDGGFTVTLAGRLVYEVYREFKDSVSTLEEAKDLLVYLDPTCDVSLEMLHGAEILQTEQPASYGPQIELEYHVRNAVKLEGLSRAMTDPHTPGIMAERVRSGDLEVEVVYLSDLVRFMQQQRRAEREEIARTGRYRVHATDEVPYGLFLFEEPIRDGKMALPASESRDGNGFERLGDNGAVEESGDEAVGDSDDEAVEGTDGDGTGGESRQVVILAVYDDHDDVRGIVVNDSPEAVAWAEATIERYRERSTDVTASFLPNDGTQDGPGE